MRDAAGMLEWMHDSQIQKHFRVPMAEKTMEDVLAFIGNASILPMDGKSIHYAIADEKDEYLGTISLKALNLQDRNAEYAISLRRCAQGRGIGQEATQKLLRIAFEEFGLERIYLNVLAENTPALHLYEKCGFVLEGESRKHLLLDGEYKTLKWYGLLREEYDNLQK